MHSPLMLRLLLQWYTKAVDYWDKQDASDNGVLGGYGHLSGPDVRDSRAFLHKVTALLCCPALAACCAACLRCRAALPCPPAALPA
jgi:hypothetical protein